MPTYLVRCLVQEWQEFAVEADSEVGARAKAAMGDVQWDSGVAVDDEPEIIGVGDEIYESEEEPILVPRMSRG